MSDAHEAWLAEFFEGRISRGSGNQWSNPMDGRQDRREVAVAFCWDGKSSFGKSISVSRDMWEKARDQARGERPMIPLRFYDTWRLDVGLDLVVIDPNDLKELMERSEKLARIEALCQEVRDGLKRYEPYEDDGPDHAAVMLAQDVQAA